MEQKRTLWIVAAAGIFLLVVVGAAVILYAPSAHQSSGFQAGFDPTSGWISSTKSGATPVPENSISFKNETESKNSEQTNALPVSPFSLEGNDSQDSARSSENLVHTDKLTVISDNATVYSNGTTTIDLNSLKSPSNGPRIVAKNELTEKELNKKQESEKYSESYEKSASPADSYYAPIASSTSSKTSAVKTESAKTVQKTQVAKAPSKSTVVKANSSKSETAKKVAANAKKAGDSFWVQAAAYTSKRNADEARTTLESNKIPSEVFTFTDSNGKTFYRVRVGPYITKSEAEYWQTRIGMIDKFASSKSVIVSTAVN